MKDNPKTALNPQEAGALIAEVTAAERERARNAIHDGVKVAQGQWIEAPLIAEALAHELVAFTEQNLCTKSMAAYLNSLAECLDARSDYH